MNENENEIPHLFRCPISLELLHDPVTLCTGQTYDRSSIQTWLSAGNLTCPVTMQKLHQPPVMVPNHALRHLIHHWLENPGYYHEFQTLHSLNSLKLCLESPHLAYETKLEAIQKIPIHSLPRNLLLHLGFLPLLLQLVFENQLRQAQLQHDHCSFLEHALSFILILLPLGGVESLNMLKDDNKLEALQALFTSGTALIRINLCRLVEATSTSSHTKQLCSMLGNNDTLLHQILLHLHSAEEAADAGVKAISALSSLEENREALVRQQGMLNGLISYISTCRPRASLAMATIEKLLGSQSAVEAMINNPKTIPCLVKMVFRVSEDDQQSSESAIGSLIILCNQSLLAREEAISGGVLTQLLLLLQSQSSGGTKTKARMLLKLLTAKSSSLSQES